MAEVLVKAPAADVTLGDLLIELRAIRRLLEPHQRPHSFLSRWDRATLTRLLPAIAGVFGSERFLIRDLFESDAPALQLVLGDLTAKQTGMLLGRADRHPVDGYVAERAGTELHTNLWRVLRVAGEPVRGAGSPPPAVVRR